MQRAQWTGAKRHFSSPLPRELPLIRSLSLHLGTCTIRDDQPKLLLQLSLWKLSKSLTHSLKKPVFPPTIFVKKPFILSFNLAVLGVWFMEPKEKCHQVGMLPWRCKMCGSGAWDSRHSLLSQRQSCVLHAGTQKQTKDKNDCEAVKKEEERWTDNSGRNVFIFFF